MKFGFGQFGLFFRGYGKKNLGHVSGVMSETLVYLCGAVRVYTSSLIVLIPRPRDSDVMHA